MPRLNHVVKLLGVIAGILLLSQFVSLKYLPETEFDPHALLAASRGLQKNNNDIPQQDKEQNAPPQKRPNQQEPNPQQQQRRNNNPHLHIPQTLSEKQAQLRKQLRHQIQREIPNIASAKTISPYLKHPLFVGKERLLTILHESHFFNDSAPEFFQDEAKVEALASKLPPWKTITDRLGSTEPALVGLDTCEQYRSLVPPLDRMLGVAGLFATGTNLLASLLVSNCRNPERLKKEGGIGVRWQVNWGKHVRSHYSNKLPEAE